MQFINDRMKTMGKKIKDLDDVRVAMMCLELIREEFIGYWVTVIKNNTN